VDEATTTRMAQGICSAEGARRWRLRAKATRTELGGGDGSIMTTRRKWGGDVSGGESNSEEGAAACSMVVHIRL
jgi:hypothetical protein